MKQEDRYGLQDNLLFRFVRKGAGAWQGGGGRQPGLRGWEGEGTEQRVLGQQTQYSATSI